MANEYFWPLPNGFPPGSRAIIKGTSIKDASYAIFGINFSTESQQSKGETDIAYHIAARYGSGYVVNNSFIVGKGGLFIDGNHFSDFRHRIPHEKIQSLAVVASVRVSSISVDKIPTLIWPLCNGFPPEQLLKICGTTGKSSLSGEFAIEFHTCAPCDVDGDIPYRISVRLSEGCVLNNSYRCGDGWGAYEIHDNLPFKFGKEFELAITNRAGNFNVFMNGEEFCKYKHRIPSDEITHLVIRDDVSVSSISVSELPKIELRIAF